jgi:DNA-binding transcriptional ArsR family regulator
MSNVDAHSSPGSLSRAQALGVLRAAGEATRLRILALLADSELNVKDLTQILGQSQPRISRHLKLMAEAGLITRFREGSWVFFRLADSGSEAELAAAIVASLDAADPVFARDCARASAVKKAREDAAQNYFREHAGEWDRIRALHVAERDVEAAVDEALGKGPYALLVDLGTGTGRMLELFAQPSPSRVGRRKQADEENLKKLSDVLSGAEVEAQIKLAGKYYFITNKSIQSSDDHLIFLRENTAEFELARVEARSGYGRYGIEVRA